MQIWGAKETYTVNELHSPDQARLVEEALSKAPGVARVEADPAKHTISVLYRVGQTNAGSIEAAIRRLGFVNVRRA